MGSTDTPISEGGGDLLPSAFPLVQRAIGRRCLDRQKGLGREGLGQTQAPGHVRAARHRQARIPSYHFDPQPRCSNLPVFLEPQRIRHLQSPLFVDICLFLVVESVSVQILGLVPFPLPLILTTTSHPHSSVISRGPLLFPVQSRSCTQI